MPGPTNKLSTTALAKKLGIPSQQLFATLKDYEWIRRAGDTWSLTPKGEFEGGSYQKSSRYGTYIVWPEKLDQHPLIQAIEQNQRVTAATIATYYSQLSTSVINRALAELGLQVHTLMGWELTERGRHLGGQQEHSRTDGAWQVTWPHELVDNPVLHRELNGLSDHIAGNETISPTPLGEEQDLFAEPSAEPSANPQPQSQGSFIALDGRALPTLLQRQVCNWLYLAQIAHASRRALPTEEVLYADFYVPAGSVYIDCWNEDAPVGELSQRLRKRDVYADLGLKSLEVNAADIDRLDEVLGKGLLAFGLRF